MKYLHIYFALGLIPVSFLTLNFGLQTWTDDYNKEILYNVLFITTPVVYISTWIGLSIYYHGKLKQEKQK